jgi:hypothetical protein
MDDSLVGLACLHPSGWDLSFFFFFPSLSLSHSPAFRVLSSLDASRDKTIAVCTQSDHDEGQEL